MTNAAGNLATIFNIPEGMTALVSGGAGDIGFAIAEAFVRNGVKTYICGRDRERCEKAATALSAHGVCLAVQADLSSVEAIRQLAVELSAREQRLDILVNNAGGAHYAGFEDFPESGWDSVFDINLKAIFFMTQALLPLLRKAAQNAAPARVINIGSAAGTQISANEAFSYSTSKAGLNYLTRKLARRLAKEAITVNTVAPGPVEGGLMDQMDEAFRQALRDEIPLGRMATPEDVAAGVLFLASKAGAYITGAVLPVDGGVTGCMR